RSVPWTRPLAAQPASSVYPPAAQLPLGFSPELMSERLLRQVERGTSPHSLFESFIEHDDAQTGAAA
ncbi:hypothetical protein, partial [Acidocella facilis]|uniref:hypothetical protein n=1 Tax=Acidocella facilis TaxID=525 RepID=UPI001F285876